MLEVTVIDDAAAACVALDPVRGRILQELRQPSSAAGLAARLGMKRQKINYHLRALEEHGLAEVAEERQWGGLTERVLVATATSYVVSPTALGVLAVDPAQNTDRLSAAYLIAVAARLIDEVGSLWRRARETGKRLPTLSIDTNVRFRSARDRAAFTRDLTAAITSLVARYHDESTPGGRSHRLVVAAHPLPQESSSKD